MAVVGDELAWRQHGAATDRTAARRTDPGRSLVDERAGGAVLCPSAELLRVLADCAARLYRFWARTVARKTVVRELGMCEFVDE